MNTQDPYWFHKKWGVPTNLPIEELYQKVEELEQKYADALVDIKRLEEENIETSNVLYELMNSIDALDNRIDILFGEKND